jgi:hypothetical protein
MPVAWDELQLFIDECEAISTTDEWNEKLTEAQAMDEATGALAVEHLYLHEIADE